MSETENTSSEQQETQAPNKRRSQKWMVKFGVYRLKCIAV